MIVMESNTTSAPARQAAVGGLAVVGFVALITLGLLLGVYAGRFVPDIASGIGSAAVYLGSVFTPNSDSSSPLVAATSTNPFLSTSSTTISFGGSPATTPAPKRPVARTPGSETSGTYPLGGSATTTATLYGLPDLTVTIDAIGYLATTSAESFVASSTVPAGSRPAVRFTVKNSGTNRAGPWVFSASIPTQTSYLYQSQPQQALLPGDSIQYTLGFDQANTGANQPVSITVNYDRAVTESNTTNDSASASLTILGS